MYQMGDVLRLDPKLSNHHRGVPQMGVAAIRLRQASPRPSCHPMEVRSDDREGRGASGLAGECHVPDVQYGESSNRVWGQIADAQTYKEQSKNLAG